jgi:hypothetical protein
MIKKRILPPLQHANCIREEIILTVTETDENL